MARARNLSHLFLRGLGAADDHETPVVKLGFLEPVGDDGVWSDVVITKPRTLTHVMSLTGAPQQRRVVEMNGGS